MAGQTFDVAAALKEFPESEVAAHLAEQHGINRDAYLKEGLTDTEFLKEYGSQPLPGAVAAAPSAATTVQNEPLATAGAGAILGGAGMAGKKTIDIAQALNKLTAPPAPAPAPLPYDQLSPGEKWSVKTGFGSGTGETVEAQDTEYKRIKAEKEKPIGRGKVSSKVSGGSPEQILARAEAEDLERQRLAQIRAEQKMAKEAAEKAAGKVAAAEKKYHLPNKLGTALPVAGATLGYNLQDVANQVREGDVGQAAIGTAGAAGSVAPFIKKLPPKLRAIGTAASLLAPVVNRGIDVVEEKAHGGLVHLAKGGSALKKGLELVKGALPPLPRAPAKSKAEIEAIAQRMAPQQLGLFAQKPGETMSVAGKSRKQFEREKSLVHDIEETPHQLSDLPDVDYTKHLGAVATGLPGDKSGVATIKGVAGTKLEAPSVQEGGAPYGLHYQAMNPDLPPELWASTGDAARRYMNFGKQVAHQYGTENVLPHYMSMPQGMGYAQHLADVNLKGLRPSGADLNKLTDIVRKGSFKGKTFQDFPGFENMDEVYEMMKHNPELRQFFNNRLQVQDVAKSVGLPPTYGTDTLHAVTMPGLREVETGAGGNVIGKLDLQRQMTPTAHNTYSPGRDPGLNIPGEAIGSSKYLMPYDLMYADSLQAVRANPKQAPQEFGSLKMVGPRQTIDQQFVDEVEQYREAMKKLTGKKKGGLATLKLKKK